MLNKLQEANLYFHVGLYKMAENVMRKLAGEANDNANNYGDVMGQENILRKATGETKAGDCSQES